MDISSAKVGYVILCHTNPDQVLRLSRTVRAMSDRARVLIRHDQPAGFINHADADAAGADLLISEIRGRWGNWSLVEATLEALGHLRDLHDPDWSVVISGQDYPVSALRPWEDRLFEGPYGAVMTSEPLGHARSGLRPGGTRHRLQMRYTHRWYWLPRLDLVSRLPAALTSVMRRIWFRYVYPLQALVVLNALPRDGDWALGLRRCRVPWSSQMPLYKGSQWMALSREAVTTALEGRLAQELQKFFATTLVPDEAYFQTVLENDGHIQIRREPVSWLRWTGDGSPHPDVLDEEGLRHASTAGAPFARKFDESRIPGVLDAADRVLGLEADRRCNE